jgi:hypothetical protein
MRWAVESSTFKMQKTGSIDERGYLRGMDRRGYSAPKCILELVANSLDSLDKVVASPHFVPTIVFDIRRETISQIDNGTGMLLDRVDAMFAMHRENHSDETSRGVSGIGAKPALSILSGKMTVHIYTHAVDGPYLHVVVPWDKIHSTGIYTGMVEFGQMTEAEQIDFIHERELNGMLNGGRAHGTSIRFVYRDDLTQLLEANFKPIEHEDALKNPLDRMGIVFGHDNVDMVLKSFEQPAAMHLQQYNYFDAADSAFYCGTSEHIIRHYRCAKDDHDRFILLTEDNPMEIKKDGRGLTKIPEKVSVGMLGYSIVGEFKVVCGLRLDKGVFDPDAPVEMGASKNTGAFNTKHIGDNELFLGSYKLVRNNQLIGLIPQPDISISSARGGGDTYLDYILVQTELQFNPVSKQDNYQDIICGIQENKNQFNGADVPKQLTRLVAFAKKMKVREIKHFFESRLATQARPEPTPPPAESQEEGESEEEEEAQEEEAQEAQPAAAPPPFVDLQEPEDERGQELAPPYEEPIRPVPASVILEAFHEMLDDRTDYTREELLEVVNSLFAEIFP